jgi:hypothetical protein
MQVNWVRFDGYGSDIFKDSYYTLNVPGNAVLPVSQKRWISSMRTIKLELAYLLNPATNAKLFVNVTDRKEFLSSAYATINSDKIFYFGLRTDLRNLYYDF